MTDLPTNQTVFMIAVICVATAMYYLLVIQPRQRKENTLRDERNWERERVQRETADKNAQRQSDEMKHLVATFMTRQASREEKSTEAAAESAGLNSGGYIIFDMPESKKSMFHDLLKGFEEYARLKGYNVTFSIDNSFPDKTAFKFTLDARGGIRVSTAQVEQDLKDYILKIQRNEPLDDLPVVLPPELHSIAITALKTRIIFVESNLKLLKTNEEFLRGLVRQMSERGLSIAPPQNIYMLSGDGSQAHNLQALNSPQAAVGYNNRLIGNRNDQSIRIANSFNEKKEQVDALYDLWSKILRSSGKFQNDEENTKLNKARELVQKAKNEIEDEESPDPSRVTRWLTKTKEILGTLALTEEVVESLKKVWELFGLS